MADPRNNFYNQEHQYREQRTTRDDFISFAQANANYCYQLSLWWWHAYNQQQAVNQSWDNWPTDQNCECAERNVVIEGDCDCCQNNAGFEYVCDTQTDGNMTEKNVCNDCPVSECNYVSPYWRSWHGERSSRANRHGLIFRRNDNETFGIDNKATDLEIGEDDDGDDDDVGDDSIDDNDDGDDDDSDVNMEVDDNFRKFLEQSEKHRQERERRKQEILEEKDDYIEVGSIHLNTTTCAPTEQPGRKRKEEMTALYGKHASVIMALEASLQLNYNKNCDKRQPIFWPSIPLKF